MPTPAVIEKQNVDLELSKGLNESVRPEHLDWQKYAKRSDNIDFAEEGLLTCRQGISTTMTTDSDTEAYSPVYRLLPTSEGLAFIGADFRLYQVNEGSGDVRKKYVLPEFSVEPVGVGAAVAVPSYARAYGSAVTDKHVVSVFGLPYTNGGSTSQTATVIIKDRESGNVLLNYKSSIGAGPMCLVDGRYVIISAGTTNLKIDLDSASFTTTSVFGYGGAGTEAIASVPLTNGFAVLMNNGDVVKYTLSAYSAHGACGLTRATGIDYNGTSFYVAGYTGSARCLKVMSAALAVTKTVTDASTADTDVTNDHMRVAVGTANGSSEYCYLVAYHAETGLTNYDIPCAYIYQCDAASGGAEFNKTSQLPLWVEVGLPFYMSQNGGFYLPAGKLAQQVSVSSTTQTLETATVLSSVCMIKLNGELPWENAGGSADGWAGFPASAVIDSYVDNAECINATSGHIITDGQGVRPQRVYCSSDIVSICCASKSTFSSSTYETKILKLYNAKHFTSDSSSISGGVLSVYDGQSASEYCFVDQPSIFTDAGTGTTNSRSFVAVYEFKDRLGLSHFSKTSLVATVETDDSSVDIEVTCPTVTNHTMKDITSTSSDGTGIVVHLYASEVGGTQYNLVETKSIEETYVTFTVSMTASYTANAAFYRQPGTQGTSLDRHSALAASHVVRHKDRIFYSRGSNVYYSSFFVDGEAPWFHPAFQFFVPTGIGDITALASMDGILVIFKRNSIFVVDGDGPPENGGNGTEFSPPRQVMTEFGCIDARSLVYTPKGLMYRSARGIELLDRSLQVANFFGERVFRTVDAYPFMGGSTFDRKTGRAMWAIGATEGTYSGQLSASGNGATVVYEVTSDTWTVYKYRTNNAYGKSIQDLAYVPVKIGYADTVLDKLMLGDGTSLLYESEVKYDTIGNTDYFIPMVLETGYIKSPSKQDRIRIGSLLIAGIRKDAFALNVGYAADYAQSYTSCSSFANSVTSGLSFTQLESHPPKELVQSMSFQISTADPGVALSDGKQIDIFGLSVKVGLKGGGAKIAAAQKG